MEGIDQGRISSQRYRQGKDRLGSVVEGIDQGRISSGRIGKDQQWDTNQQEL